MENEEMDRIELLIHGSRGSPPFAVPDESYILTFPPNQDNRASRAVTALLAAAHANPDYAIELPRRRAVTAVTKDGMGLVAVWSDESWALLGQTHEHLRVLVDAVSPRDPKAPSLDDLSPQAAALWDTILQMAEEAKLKGLAEDIDRD